MYIRFYADLIDAMHLWINEHCEEDEWDNIVIGNKTAEYMANAAASVFDACAESQQYGVKEGFLKEE
jgi:hypothetical protein